MTLKMEEEAVEEGEELINGDDEEEEDADDDLLDQLNQRARRQDNGVDLAAALQTKSPLVRVADWLCDQEEPAPDDWIDKYVEGTSPVVAIRRSQDSSSLRARPEKFWSVSGLVSMDQPVSCPRPSYQQVTG